MTFDSVLSVLMLLFDTVDISKFSETLNCLCLFDVFWRAFNLSGPPATKHRYMGPETPLHGTRNTVTGRIPRYCRKNAEPKFTVTWVLLGPKFTVTLAFGSARSRARQVCENYKMQKCAFLIN